MAVNPPLAPGLGASPAPAPGFPPAPPAAPGAPATPPAGGLDLGALLGQAGQPGQPSQAPGQAPMFGNKLDVHA
ncbi:MAG TPA: hypothetical protein V6C99_08685 [Oculatellaceae cyanobacterium]